MVFKFFLFFLFPCCLFSFPNYREPWGKNSDLRFQRDNTDPLPFSRSLPLIIIEKVIWFHQNVISPIDGPRSHFKPSSSTYMLQAVRKHGLIKGYWMGCSRLLRENNDPWVYRTAVIEDVIWKLDFP